MIIIILANNIIIIKIKMTYTEIAIVKNKFYNSNKFLFNLLDDYTLNHLLSTWTHCGKYRRIQNCCEIKLQWK